jgi:hypothetical protein
MNGPRLGNGRLDAIQVVGPLTLTDTTLPCLALQWSPGAVRGDNQNEQRHNATVTIAPTGATGSKLLLTLTVTRKNFVGDAIASLTYVISGAAAKVAWSSTTASGTASAATLKDVVDLINQIEGFKAWALHAPYAMSVNNGNFIALAATAIKTGVGPEGRSDILHRDVSAFTDANSDKVLWARVGLPEERDRNALRLLRVEGTATGVTNGVLKVYRDDVAEYGLDQEVYLEKTLGTTAVFTNYLDRTIENADTIRGPVLLEVRSDDVSVASFTVGIMQASLGA